MLATWAVLLWFQLHRERLEVQALRPLCVRQGHVDRRCGVEYLSSECQKYYVEDVYRIVTLLDSAGRKFLNDLNFGFKAFFETELPDTPVIVDPDNFTPHWHCSQQTGQDLDRLCIHFKFMTLKSVRELNRRLEPHGIKFKTLQITTEYIDP